MQRPPVPGRRGYRHHRGRYPQRIQRRRVPVSGRLLPEATSSEQQARQCLEAGDCPQAVVQPMLTADRAFARCMRSHGVPNWPDPTLGSEGGPVFNLVPAGITHSQTHSQPVSGKIGECQRLDPAPVGLESN